VEPEKGVWAGTIAQHRTLGFRNNTWRATGDDRRNYRSTFAAVREEPLDGMPAILEDEFRRRADVDEHESSV
jgi:hypothetical protein